MSLKKWNIFKEEATKTLYIVGIVACLNEKQEFLLVKRSQTDKIKPGYWEFPGGHVDNKDDSIEEAAARELKEEAGLSCDVENLKYLGFQQTKRLSVEQPPKKITIKRYFFLSTQWSGVPQIVANPQTGIEEHDDIKWATKEEILSIDNTEIPHYLLDKALDMMKTDEGISSNDPRNKEKDKAGRNRSRPDRIRETEDEECGLQDEGVSSNDPRNKEKDKAGRNRSHKDRIREEEELKND